MIELYTVAIGSVPKSLAPKVRAGDFVVSTWSTRLQATDVAADVDMFSEFRALADGIGEVGCEPEPHLVRKAQIPGPVTLIQAGVETLQTSIRRIRAAIDRLLELHPLLEEIWLDEPMLGSSPDDWTHVLGHGLRALKSEYFDLKFGVHCCSHLRSFELASVPADAWAFDLSLSLQAVISAKRSGNLQGEIVWCVVPTSGAVSALAAADLVALHRELQPESPIRLSTTCGLGTLEQDQAEHVIVNLSTIYAEVRDQLDR